MCLEPCVIHFLKSWNIIYTIKGFFFLKFLIRVVNSLWCLCRLCRWWEMVWEESKKKWKDTRYKYRSSHSETIVIQILQVIHRESYGLYLRYKRYAEKVCTASKANENELYLNALRRKWGVIRNLSLFTGHRDPLLIVFCQTK